MLKKEYYCLIAGFPDLFFEENKPAFSCTEFKNELQKTLSKTDFGLASLLFLPYDNKNLAALLFKTNGQTNNMGNYPTSYIESQVKNPTGLPSYMANYILWVTEKEIEEFNLQAENVLTTLFYEHLFQTKNPFLRKWFQFELNIKNLLTHLNCTKHGYQTEGQLINAGDKETIEIFQNKKLKPENIEEYFPHASQVFKIYESGASIIEKEQAIDKLKWEYLDEATFFYYFTIERVINLVIKLMIIERWLKTDRDTGTALLNKLIEELKISYTIPNEYNIN